MENPYKSIGKNIRKKGALERLVGAPVFSADIELENPLVLKVLRSGRTHAEILSINTEKAIAIPGVVRVFTCDDIHGKNLMGIINRDQPLLATGKVRSTSDPVALVAAETEQAAQAALKAIAVTYEDLPAVFDPQEAMKAEAPRIHEDGNILLTRTVQRGNPDHAFKDCHRVIEKTYQTSMIEHNYLEPDAGTGFVDEDGTLVIYASTQNPHYDHKEVVSLLGVENNAVRIIQAATGGGFGSKLDLNLQGFIGLALYHLKRPVRCVYSREEAYLATAKRHPLTITMKTGVDDQGKLKAMQATIICDTGAYGSYGIAVASRAAVHATGPYQIDNVDIQSHCVYTNKPFCGAMRGFGTPQIAFAHESQMDLHAKDLGLDPLEIRMCNAFNVGSVTATGQTLSASVGIVDCLEALKPYYEKAKKSWLQSGSEPHKCKGIGVGAMWYGIGNTGTKNPSNARVEMDEYGRVTLFTGCADIGQGSSTVLSQIAAETLGIQPDNLRLVAGDTGLTPNAGATSASRQTYISGNAVKDAAEKLAHALKTEAAQRLGVAVSTLVLDSGIVRAPASPDRQVSFADLARQIIARGESLVFQGHFDPLTTPLDPETGQGVPYTTYAFACQLALTTADALTGEVTVEKIVAAHDVGKAIHPQNVIGQICGGVAMGLGFALMEKFEPGNTLSMKDYHIPTCADMPEVVPIIVESEEPSGPFGAKGVGEPALIPTAPAILNGLANALGKRIYALPADLESVLETSIASGHFGPESTSSS
ncbi:MAG: xanthine dehydrogenase family protein molybdopterin-binding subunit [Thermodesulfobacteriota bacterium]